MNEFDLTGKNAASRIQTLQSVVGRHPAPGCFAFHLSAGYHVRVTAHSVFQGKPTPVCLILEECLCYLHQLAEVHSACNNGNFPILAEPEIETLVDALDSSDLLLFRPVYARVSSMELWNLKSFLVVLTCLRLSI